MSKWLFNWICFLFELLLYGGSHSPPKPRTLTRHCATIDYAQCTNIRTAYLWDMYGLNANMTKR